MVDNDIMFSVEVTTYNQKDFIAQTLQSIIDQKHNYKYEILVSDDCSTDGTQDVIREFEKKYPYVVKPVYNEKNIGAMANYYATVARAQGKYLMECAGDDYWLPGKVEKQIAFMERNLDFDVCYGNANFFYSKQNVYEGIFGGNYLDFKNLFFQGNHVPALTLCIRREFFMKYMREIMPEKKNWLMEDYPFLLYAAFESSIYFINRLFAVYRVVENSLSHQVDLDKQLNFKKSVYEIRKFFSERYSLKLEPWNEKVEYKKLLNKENNLVKFVKKIFKAFIPYGLIVLRRKIISK